jgi:hypothetical protein
MPTDISTDMLGAQQEVCCLLQQFSITISSVIEAAIARV